MIKCRTVIDTNVVVSAILLPLSVPRQAFDLAVTDGRPIFSADTLVELDEVLRRPKFEKYISQQRRLEFLSALVDDADIVSIQERIHVCRD